jgi:hypothetical protein
MMDTTKGVKTKKGEYNLPQAVMMGNTQPSAMRKADQNARPDQ